MIIDEYYTFQVSVSKEAYKNKAETKAALGAEKTGELARKELDIKRKISFKTISCTPQQLLDYALDGHTFCTVHDNFPENDYREKKFYTYSDGYYTMTAKASRFFKESCFVGVDIDETAYKSPQDFIERLTCKPTFWYTSLSNQYVDTNTGQSLGSRFRLIYVFDIPITGKYFFRYCADKIHKYIETATNESIHDKCGIRCDQYFNGTNRSDESINLDYGITSEIYSFDDFSITMDGFSLYLDNYCEYKTLNHNKEIDYLKCVLFSRDNISNIISNNNFTIQLISDLEKSTQLRNSSVYEQTLYISQKEKEYLSDNSDIEIDNRLVYDARNFTFEDFYKKYKHRYENVYRTETAGWKIFHDEDLGDIKYQYCTEDYLELRWISIRDPSGQILKVTDGHHRRSTLFNRAWLRRIIKPEITPDELFYNLMVDREKFFDNGDDVLTIDCLINKVRQAFKESPEYYIDTYNDVYADTIEHCRKKKIIIHRTFKKKIRPISLVKKLRWEFIDVLYNKNLPVKDNLQLLQEEGVEIGKSTLYDYCKSRGIKGKNLRFDMFAELHKDGMSLSEELKYLSDNGLKISNKTLRNYRLKLEHNHKDSALSNGSKDSDVFNLNVRAREVI